MRRCGEVVITPDFESGIQSSNLCIVIPKLGKCKDRNFFLLPVVFGSSVRYGNKELDVTVSGCIRVPQCNTRHSTFDG